MYPSVYIVMVYFMSGLPVELSRFLMYWAMGVMTSLVAQSVGIAIGAAFKLQVYGDKVITLDPNFTASKVQFFLYNRLQFTWVLMLKLVQKTILFGLYFHKLIYMCARTGHQRSIVSFLGFSYCIERNSFILELVVSAAVFKNLHGLKRYYSFSFFC